MTDKKFNWICVGLFFAILTFAESFVNWLFPIGGV